MRVFVVGGTRLIGPHAVQLLVEAGHHVNRVPSRRTRSSLEHIHSAEAGMPVLQSHQMPGNVPQESTQRKIELVRLHHLRPVTFRPKCRFLHLVRGINRSNFRAASRHRCLPIPTRADGSACGLFSRCEGSPSPPPWNECRLLFAAMHQTRRRSSCGRRRISTCVRSSSIHQENLRGDLHANRRR